MNLESAKNTRRALGFLFGGIVIGVTVDHIASRYLNQTAAPIATRELRTPVPTFTSTPPSFDIQPFQSVFADLAQRKLMLIPPNLQHASLLKQIAAASESHILSRDAFEISVQNQQKRGVVIALSGQKRFTRLIVSIDRQTPIYTNLAIESELFPQSSHDQPPLTFMARLRTNDIDNIHYGFLNPDRDLFPASTDHLQSTLSAIKNSRPDLEASERVKRLLLGEVVPPAIPQVTPSPEPRFGPNEMRV